MQVLFREIVDGDIDKVIHRFDAHPEMVNLVATGSPLKHNGQSPLQVSIKIGQFGIARMLVDRGADINFIDLEGDIDRHLPVLHDAVIAAVMRSRWSRKVGYSPDNPTWELSGTKSRADEAFEMLQLLLERGADPEALDSLGNSLLVCATFNARQILPAIRYNDPKWVDPRPVTEELIADLSCIFNLLYRYGADPSKIDPDLKTPLDTFFRAEAVAQFLRRDS